MIQSASMSYRKEMLEARRVGQVRIRKFIHRIGIPNSVNASEAQLVESLLRQKNVPKDISTVIAPYLGAYSDYEIKCVTEEYYYAEEKQRWGILIERALHIEVISLLRHMVLAALDDGNVSVFKYILGTTSAVWDPLREDGIGFRDFRSSRDRSQFAPLLAHLVCYRGKAWDPQWFGPALKSHSSYSDQATYMSMGSGPIRSIKDTIARGNHIAWNCGVLLKAALSGDRNPDVIAFLTSVVNWVRTIHEFFINKEFDPESPSPLTPESMSALRADMERIVASKGHIGPDSVVFLTEIVKWGPDRITFLEKALLKAVKCEDLRPNIMAFLEELFS